MVLSSDKIEFKKSLLGLPLSLGSFNEVTRLLIESAAERTGGFACVANVHMWVEAMQDSSFGSVLKQARWVLPDGMPLVQSLKWLHGIKQERVAGMDLLPALLEKAGQEGLSVFFYGGTSRMLESTEHYCQKEFPGLTIAGVYSPPFRNLLPEEEDVVVDMIQHSRAHLVFVILGCPKQERWMARVSPRLSAVLIGVGGALPVLLGWQKRAPRWMQQMSLEWLFRLIQEPKRLFKRYFFTNSIFIFKLSQAMILKSWKS